MEALTPEHLGRRPVADGGIEQRDALLRIRWDVIAWALLITTTALRATLLRAFELAPDEAYYWDWSRHLSAGYYDQGPLIAYVIRLGTALLGTNEAGVRVGVLLASFGAVACCWALARRIYGPLAGMLTVLVLAATPLLAIGSLIATYDPPLVLFWAVTLVCLERALFPHGAGPTSSANRTDVRRLSRVAPASGDERVATVEPASRAGAGTALGSTLWWMAAGLAAGLGFLSKHTMLLIVPCLLLFLLASPPHRGWLRRWEPYGAFAITFACYSGVFWWNAHHHWWTFGHLLFLAAKGTQPLGRRIGDLFGSQAALLGPALFIACLAAGIGGLRPAGRLNSATAQRSLFLALMGLPVFAFFLLMAFKAKVQGNWPPCAWLSLSVLFAGWAASAIETGRRPARGSAIAAIAASAVSSGLLAALLFTPQLRVALGVRLPADADLSNTTYGWRSLAAHVETVRREMARDGRPVFICGNGYQYPSLMAFYLPDHPATYDMFLHYRLTMYAAYVGRMKQMLGDDAVFLNDGMADDGDLRLVFAGVTWDTPFQVWRRPLYHVPVKTVFIARCHNFQRYVGLSWTSGG